MLEAQERELEANARGVGDSRTSKRGSESCRRNPKADRTIKEDVKQATVLIEKNIRPEIWPSEEEFQFAKTKIQYDSQKLHFGICGCSGSEKSSPISAFRGLKNNSSQPARAGILETTTAVGRYPDARIEMPCKCFVLFDCPAASMFDIFSWQYFNQQGFFIFDIITLVNDSRFPQIDVAIIQNCEPYKIPVFIIRSKVDQKIQSNMQDLGYEEDDHNADDHYDDYQTRGRQMLIDTTRENLEKITKKLSWANTMSS